MLPGPTTGATDALVRLERSWDTRDEALYRELFTADFRFVFAPGDSAGDRYQDRAWGRDDELASAANLFGGGGGPSEPAVTGIMLDLGGASLPGTLQLPGKPYPWHCQILVSLHSLQVDRSDGTVLRSTGSSLFYLVRGDSALLPQELIDRGFTADSTRWYIERWEDMPDPALVPDCPPVVVAPGAITGRVWERLTFQVTAYDPNLSAITSLSATGTAAEFFAPNASNTTGTLMWTPTISEVGAHLLTFTAANVLSGSAVTLVTVLPPIQAPVASLVATPSSGSEPLVVVLDASGSHDFNGTIVGYHFDFGDGRRLTQAQPVVSHSYQAGVWRAAVTVTDDEGAMASASQTITVAPAPAPQPNLVGNPSFESGLGGWKGYAGGVIARVPGGFEGAFALQVTGPEVIAGSFGVNDSPDWIKPTPSAGRRYRFTAWVHSPNSAGVARLCIREYSLATKMLLGQVLSNKKTLSPDWQMIQVDYTTMSGGSSLDFHVRDYPVTPGEVIMVDDISIRDITDVAGLTAAEGEFEVFPQEGPLLQPALFPSPVRSASVLTFATSRPGALRVEIIDLAGRRVRTLTDETDSPPGMHVFTIGSAADDGQRLQPGVYFYRIQAAEGARNGRFVVIR